MLVAGKIFALCDPSKRECMMQHVAEPSSDEHKFRFAHGRQKKKAKTGPPVGRPVGSRSTSTSRAPTPTPNATVPGPRQQQGASAAWDQQQFRSNVRRRSSGAERGSSAEDSSGESEGEHSS